MPRKIEAEAADAGHEDQRWPLAHRVHRQRMATPRLLRRLQRCCEARRWWAPRAAAARGIRTPRRRWIRVTSITASSEWPPSAKKLSVTPTRSRCSSSPQIAAISRSTSLRGATNVAAPERAAGSAAPGDRPCRSTTAASPSAIDVRRHHVVGKLAAPRAPSTASSSRTRRSRGNDVRDRAFLARSVGVARGRPPRARRGPAPARPRPRRARRGSRGSSPGSRRGPGTRASPSSK